MLSITPQASPVKPSERADILDVLRGFAILGIFLANTYGFTGYGSLNQAGREALTTYPSDAILRFLQTVLVDGKFYSLFSLLFGVGFSILLFRSEQKGVDLAAVHLWETPADPEGSASAGSVGTSTGKLSLRWNHARKGAPLAAFSPSFASFRRSGLEGWPAKAS